MSSPDSFMSNSTTPGPDPLLVDRTQWPDYLIVAITGLCSLLLFVGGIILIFIRNYEPIKNKQIHIILPSTFSGVIFMLSSLVVNNHFIRAEDSFWALCVFWTFWVNLTLGLGPWLSCLILRPFRLLYTFRLRKAITPLKALFILGLMITPWIIFAIFAQIFNGWAYRTDKMICQNNGIGWTIGIFVGIGLYILVYLIVAGLLYRVRKNKLFKEYLSQYYYEFPIIKIGVIIVLVMTVANAIVWIVKQILDVSNDARVWGRFFLTFTSVFMVTFFFFATLAKPMFKYFFDREGYLVKYRTSVTTLRQETMEATAKNNSTQQNGEETKLEEIKTKKENEVEVTRPQQSTNSAQKNSIDESDSSESNAQPPTNERPQLSQESAMTTDESSSDSESQQKNQHNQNSTAHVRIPTGY